ncbi:radical SAM enzyme, Cfr family protein [gamma proteobacterium BDW918]|uniref:Dual-specificity RNA methyltransferase RlmN n=1 Tax=Zhongshania aliphaticivorans TaxID=1470434 RepID=A0A127M759_9GAMM|nr:23S rRNA (adenine(2503)-C(2))-methyltransferase RlmN [Zhongshania aliphaticivorans]AMO69046.1 23S rRNA (adenine(2503)-C2)-methyltransferase [Zhongshania aliphaticivorans]EIF43692.1 radical SAM enzyme, Cfr family protein [gamma proteobacterium BDW918]
MASENQTEITELVQQPRVNLLGMSRKNMEAYLSSIGEKPFRAQQILKWIHHSGIDNFDEMTNLGKPLRAKLQELAEIRPPTVVKQLDSIDGTRKWAVEVGGNNLVEAVLIPDGQRGTLCVSSQVGCSLDCSFCATGKQGFMRDLTAAEIIGQVWLAIKSYDGFNNGNKRIVTNVVMMGMGEPLLNFDNVVEAMSLMLDDFGYGLSKRRVTLSTSGVVPMLDKLGDVSTVSLAISLHAPNDELRSQLVPINKKYPIAELLAASKRYIAKQDDTHRVVTIEYTLIAGVNDGVEHAKELAEVLRDLPCKVNLIPFNPFSLSNYKRPSNNAVNRFWLVMTEAGYVTTVRTPRGDDIDAACGQLAGQVQDRTKRSERHRQKAELAQPIRLV